MKKITKAKSKKLELENLNEDTGFEDENDMDLGTANPAPARKSKAWVTMLAVVVLVLLAGYKFKAYLVPAMVGDKPIFFWQYISFLHKTYGKEAIQTITTQAIVDQELVRSGVVVSPQEVQTEIDNIDKQASSSGGIKAMLAAQQMTMDQLKDQIRIQFAVKKILKDKIAVTDDEIADAYKKNKDFFKGSSEADAKQKLREQLENQKFQKEASSWLADLRKKTTVKINLPGFQLP